jgi:ABC-type transport system involved in multi-copper enzyme maturation permease subunit
VSLSWTRIGAIVVKELNDYRRNRFVIVFTMTILPLIFIVAPTISLLSAPAVQSSSRLDARVGISLLYMLLIPATVPSAVSAYSVIGEREQGTLEPILITPIRSEEFLIGKAIAVIIPTLAVAYTIFGLFLAIAALFAHPGIESAIFSGSHILVQLVFTPLLAGWSIWVGIAISARSSDVRAAQQLSVFANLPPLGIVALMTFSVITPSTGLALALAAALLAIDALGWRAVASMFDRERLITGTRGRRRSATQTATSPITSPSEGSHMSATLTMRREGVGIELRRGPFEIELDGSTVGRVGRHETFETKVEPGHHTLQLRAGRYSSQPHAFDVADGTDVAFRCHAPMVWPRYAASLIAPALGISLKRD